MPERLRGGAFLEDEHVASPDAQFPQGAEGPVNQPAPDAASPMPLHHREVMQISPAPVVPAQDSPDDVAVNREVISELLRNAGFRVVTAATGDQALELVESERFDAVVLDAFMPGTSGLQVAEKLRSSGERCPLVGLSAATEPALISACLASGMDRVFSKPANIELLTSTLLELIAPRGDDVPLLNGRVLGVLREAVGEARCEELCGEAEIGLCEQLEALETTLGDGHGIAAAQVAHRLAGIASSVGLERLGNDAEQLSVLLRGGAVFHAAQFDAIRAVAGESLAALQSDRRPMAH